MSAKEIVTSAVERLFNQKDLVVVDEVFGPVYVQHSALGPDGVDGLKGLIGRLPAASGYELVRALADGELVVTEGVFTGFAPVPLTGYDVWRLVDGRVVEHWDALGAAATHATGEESGAGSGDVAVNRSFVAGWVENGLIGGDPDAVAASVGEGGRDAFVDPALVYSALHAVIADGDLVYTRSEGSLEGPVIINDVWRVKDGRIVERWGLVAPVPAEFPHSNGAF
ncbi:nuclear transport factor 2 family protein [Herbiconiux moechotypicola]|uniref:Nuclear transport factor 2 family protein n=1 Tax=Herbiconiux moechotypicola TaxID=637393 RepID=A0ABN3DHQ3_9MICO|nr:nuclear transport factor 2 family protein [Herbiconiux moechotypicola]MCS5729667.1 nuclear transport factor 2 family protein [Herbiconiux moechotypicola]